MELEQLLRNSEAKSEEVSRKAMVDSLVAQRAERYYARQTEQLSELNKRLADSTFEADVLRTELAASQRRVQTLLHNPPPAPKETVQQTPGNKDKRTSACSLDSLLPSSPVTPSSPLYTPRSRTKKLLKQCFMSPKKVSDRIKRRLEVNFATMSAMKSANKKSLVAQGVLEGLFQDEVFSKSRLKNQFRRQLGIHNRFGRKRQKEKYVKEGKKRTDTISKEDKLLVIVYYNNDNNSRIDPGIKDCVRVPNDAIGGGNVGDNIVVPQEDDAEIDNVPRPSTSSSNPTETVPGETATRRGKQRKQENKKKGKTHLRQKRHMVDYVYNVYAQFCFNYPHTKIKRTMFYELRPPNIKLVSFLDISHCLCKDHQEYAHYVSSLGDTIPGKPSFPLKPDEFIKMCDDAKIEGLLNNLTAQEVPVKVWKLDWDPNCSKKRMQLIKIHLPLDENKETIHNKVLQISWPCCAC